MPQTALARLVNPIVVAWQALAKWAVRLVAAQQRAFAGAGKWNQAREIRKQVQSLAKAATQGEDGLVLIFDHLGAEAEAELVEPLDGAEALAAALPAQVAGSPACRPVF